MQSPDHYNTIRIGYLDISKYMEYFAGSARLPSGWAKNVRISVSADGLFERVEPNAEPGDAKSLGDAVLPAMPNGHSHAFQRAMAGAAEFRAGSADNFWSWRAGMYRLAKKMDAASLYAVAHRLYVEMLKVGYTTVTEFHYLHRTGQPATPDILQGSVAPLVSAAHDAGIRLLLLPALYQRGGFDNEPLSAAQQRFAMDTQEFVALLTTLSERQSEGFRLGMCIHSLRAVDEANMGAALAAFEEINPAGPIHIHIAEQEREVADCLKHTGMRPVEWLLDRFDVDERWCLVHATHINDVELAALAKTGAVICVCPTTEANLGDGVFRAREWLNAGGRLCVGSDSNVSVSVSEELRWLEYAQRLANRERNVLSTPEYPYVGDYLWNQAVRGGSQATGAPRSGITAGAHADLVLVDTRHPVTHAKVEEGVLDALVFAGNENLVNDVMVGGEWRIRSGKHERDASSATEYAHALEGLRNEN